MSRDRKAPVFAAPPRRWISLRPLLARPARFLTGILEIPNPLPDQLVREKIWQGVEEGQIRYRLDAGGFYLPPSTDLVRDPMDGQLLFVGELWSYVDRAHGELDYPPGGPPRPIEVCEEDLRNYLRAWLQQEQPPGQVDAPDDPETLGTGAQRVGIEAAEKTPEPPSVPAKTVILKVNGVDRQFACVDLKTPPRTLPRFNARRLTLDGLRQATTEECDVIIQLIAASEDDGKTSEPTIRTWGRPLLRELFQADTTLDFIAARFLSSQHNGLQRKAGNPNLLRD